MDPIERKKRFLALVDGNVTLGARLRDAGVNLDINKFAAQLSTIDTMVAVGGTENLAELEKLIPKAEYELSQLLDEAQRQHHEHRNRESARIRAERDEKAARMTPAQVITEIEKDGHRKLGLDEHGQIFATPAGVPADLALAITAHYHPVRDLLRLRQSREILKES
jgi:hypothetical protein